MSEKLKSIVNIGTIGHIDHGKTTLTSAITKILATKYGGDTKFKKFDEIDSGKEEKERGITIKASCVPYETADKKCSHVDCPGHRDFIKNFFTGIKQLDAVILVVDSTQGVMPQTKEHLSLAKQKPIKHLMVFINKVDVADEMLVELVKSEISSLLEKNGYKDAPIVLGSALAALNGDNPELGEKAIEKIAAFIDSLPTFERDTSGPFRLTVDTVTAIDGRGNVVTGTPQRGTVAAGQTIELHYKGGLVRQGVVTEVQSYRKTIKSGVAGESIALLIRGLKHGEIGRGGVLAHPDTQLAASEIKCRIYVFSGKQDDRGRGKPFSTGFAPQFIFGFNDTVTGRIVSIDGNPKGVAEPGQRHEIEVKLHRPTTFDKLLKELVIMTEGPVNVGVGEVIDMKLI